MEDVALVSIFVAAALKAAIPGPSLLLALDGAARGGLRRGGSVALGVVLANAVFLAAGLLMARSGAALTGAEIDLFRWIGVAVTAVLAARMLFLAVKDRPGRLNGGDFAAGLGVGLASPHNMIFYIVLAPPLLIELNSGGLAFADAAGPAVAAMAGVAAVNIAAVAAGCAAQGLHARHGRVFAFASAGAMFVFSGALAGADTLF